MGSLDRPGLETLTLPATELWVPPDSYSPTGLEQREAIQALAQAEFVGPSASMWADSAAIRLAVASALEARLSHLRGARLAGFGLPRDPRTVTLRQLAALTRPHSGTAGQAFELAVADAINHGHPEVTAAVREALGELRVPAHGRLGMVVLGLEKVPRGRADELRATLKQMLPPDAVLRTGEPGRPAGMDTVLSRLTSAQWGLLPSPKQDSSASQLARADALLFTDRHLVPVSFKVNVSKVYPAGWRHVPVWVSIAGTRDPREETVVSMDTGSYKVITVRLPADGWAAGFTEALNVVDETLASIDGTSVAGQLEYRSLYNHAAFARQLKAMADWPVAEVTAKLRAIHPGLWELFGDQVRTRSTQARVPTLANPWLLESWQTASEAGNLLVGQPHLFLPAGVDAARTQPATDRRERVQVRAPRPAPTAPGSRTRRRPES